MEMKLICPDSNCIFWSRAAGQCLHDGPCYYPYRHIEQEENNTNADIRIMICADEEKEGEEQ